MLFRSACFPSDSGKTRAALRRLGFRPHSGPSSPMRLSPRDPPRPGTDAGGRASARPPVVGFMRFLPGTPALSRSDWPHGRLAFPPTRAKPAPLCGGWAFALAPVQAPLCGYPRAYWSSCSTPWGTWFAWAAPSQSPLASVSACGENYARSLAPAFPTRPAAARLGSRGGPVMLSQAMRRLRRNYRASYWSSWSTPWGTWFAWAAPS